MKTIAITLCTVFVLLALSCNKEPLRTQPAVATQTENHTVLTTAGHYIGERFGGGVIFWMTKDSLHGLISDTLDLGMGVWSPLKKLTGATDTGIGRGRSNTKKIVATFGKGSYAAYGCQSYKGGGYTDWFLPSRDELNELYRQKKFVGTFEPTNYWSSTASTISTAWGQDMGYGYQHSNMSVESNFYVRVRAIRAF